VSSWSAEGDTVFRVLTSHGESTERRVPASAIEPSEPRGGDGPAR
jgi:hypothetical protein